MLDFWYSPRCTRQIKLILCISVCCIIFLSSKEIKLSMAHALIALIVGMIYHFKYQIEKKLEENKSYNKGLKFIFFILPLIVLILLLMSLPNVGRLYLSIQTLGFTLIGFFLVSIYSSRAKKTETY